MKIKRILLTGDDGYNSVGTRLLVHFLKDKYELTIAGTKGQQSGIGGKMTFGREMEWGETTVDGVRAIWLDGTPADVAEFAKLYLKDTFDVLIAGINLGANASSGIISSGTVVGAWRGAIINLAERVLALSWMATAEHWFLDHNQKIDLQPFLDYPGQTVANMIDLIFENDFWGSRFLNVNFPEKPSHHARFTKIIPLAWDFYSSGFIDYQKKLFNHLLGYADKKLGLEYDGGALHQNYISITPCVVDFTDRENYERNKDLVFEL